MKASELVTHLQKLMANHGDLECVDSYEDPITVPEFNDDGGEELFVLAERA